ncbi:MAG TPA: DUF1697 domain-containing protein [Thermoanaerobaculia bacterium]|nr:DUF1697 domain-containing protein [Thermoanaerobaculia bacterium]
MTTHVALLRAVNLAGRNRADMAELRALLAELRLKDGRTLLQSGNLVFRSDLRPAALERLLEEAARKRLGLETELFVRSSAEWKAIIAGNPFPAEAREDPGHLLVMLLRSAPRREQVTALRNAIRGREAARVEWRHAYVFYPDGVGRSRLTTAVIEKWLGSRATGRNWNTVLKLGALV